MSCRTIHCPLHGTITSVLPTNVQAIIAYARVSTLGIILGSLALSHLVYPGATLTTRFEHSIGVSHLAGVMIKSLQTHQPNLEISERTIELVRIAGLVHDLGHGPESHLFEHVEQQNHMRVTKKEAAHAHNHGLKNTKYQSALKKCILIKGMIDPDDHQKNHYLCQIVCQSRCALLTSITLTTFCATVITLDSEQWIDMIDFLPCCRVQKYYGNLQLAWPFKLQDEIISLFQARYRLHRNVYNHRTVKASEIIIAKLLRHFSKKRLCVHDGPHNFSGH